MLLRLNPALDAKALAAEFGRQGRVRIASFLQEEDAFALLRHVRSREDWRQVLNSGDKVFELDRATRAAMTPAQHDALEQAVRKGARDGFQYRYETIRLADGNQPPASGDDPLAGFTRLLSGGAARDLLRRITGHAALTFADGQVTAYAPGDFLTGHDDAVPGKHRLAAYVFGLNPGWRIEHGGLLLFHGADGQTVSGQAPAFNTLDLFSVPAPHSVSAVAAAAPNRRYSITGWLRARDGAPGSTRPGC